MSGRRGSKTIYRREKKESGVKCNGSHPITIKTIHGNISFPLQKYFINGKSCNYFQLTYQFCGEYISPLLQELVGYYSNRLSYKEVEKLVERISGEQLLSDQKIWQIIVDKAEQISVEWQQENEEIDKIIKTDVAISSEVDIYDPDNREILLFDDAIGVKKQKENREKFEKKEIDESENISKASRKFIMTDVILSPFGRGNREQATGNGKNLS